MKIILRFFVNTLPMGNINNKYFSGFCIHRKSNPVRPGPYSIKAGKLPLKLLRGTEGILGYSKDDFIDLFLLGIRKLFVSFISLFGKKYFEHKSRVYDFGQETTFEADKSASPLRIDSTSSLLAKISRVSSQPSSSSMLTRAALALPFLVMIIRDLPSSTSSSNSRNFARACVEGIVSVAILVNIHKYVQNVKTIFNWWIVQVAGANQ